MVKIKSTDFFSLTNDEVELLLTVIVSNASHSPLVVES